MLLTAHTADGSPLTDAEIGDEVATFMVAGHETSANTLSWSLALLSAYPAARQQLEAELDSVLRDRDPYVSRRAPPARRRCAAPAGPAR